MIYSEIVEDKERVRRDLFYEVKIVFVLGDYLNLFMLFGVVIKIFLLCFVM